MKNSRFTQLVLYSLICFIASITLVNSQTLTPIEELGKAIFFDKISSPDNMACAACHAPSVGFTGPKVAINKKGAVYPGAVHQRFGNRKPPSAAYATLSPVFHYDGVENLFIGGNFWDGRATGEILGNPAADQAGGPFLNPVEQNNPDKQSVLIQIAASPYAYLWEDVWGEVLDPWDMAEVDANYDRVALSIAAYEGSPEVNSFSSKYDYYLQGLVSLTAEEAWGLDLFNDEEKGKCALCHPSTIGTNGELPLFTDFTFDNLGMPKNPDNPFYDMDEVYLPNGDPINPLGEEWIDLGLGGSLANNPAWASMAEENLGKHKVPTLRNVDKRPGKGKGFIKAYGHNGYFKSLKDIVHFYNTRDVDPTWPAPEVSDNINTEELGNLGLTDEEEDAIVAFMQTLSDGYKIPKNKNKMNNTLAIQMTTQNPVRDQIFVQFDIPEISNATIVLYDLSGNKIHTLENDKMFSAGLNILELNIGDLPSGVYVLRLHACNEYVSKKISVIH